MWLRNYPGRIVAHYQIAGLMGKAASDETAMKDFTKGYFPYERTCVQRR
jgi:hypothetical protein